MDSPASPHPASPSLRIAIVATLLFIGTALLFSRAARYGFLNYDDPAYVTANPHVQAGLHGSGVVWAFTAKTDYWHPLTWLSHMLDWQLYGASGAGPHVTSLLWHALNASLAFLVFLLLAGGLWRSAFAAALFAWHPLRVESVVWITERKDVMSGCFFLLTVLAYARYVDARAAGRTAWRRYLVTLACFAAGLMSKPMLVTVPVVLLVLDGWPFRRFAAPGATTALLVEKLPFFALSAADAVATVLLQRHEGAFVLTLPFSERLANALVSIARYLGKLVWPADLIVCYEHPGAWPVLAVAGSAALVIGLCALAWWQRRSRPWIAAGLAWFVVMLLPTLGLIQVGFQAMADRYTYLPMLGIELALLWSFPAPLARATRVALGALAALALATCAALTWTQIGVWRDSVSLFTHAVRHSERNDIAEGFLASAYFAEHRFDEAAIHAERAHALNPNNDRVLVTLGGLCEQRGQSAQAIVYYREALALRPGDPRVLCQLGLIELRNGDPASAKDHIGAALRSDPRLCNRTLELARGEVRRGSAASALVLYRLVLDVEPDNAEANGWVGGLLLAQGDPSGAIAPLRRAVRRVPDSPDLQLTLARCAVQLGTPSEADAALGRVAALAQDNAGLLSEAAELYAQMRDFPHAIALSRRVVALVPANANAHAALGYLLLASGDRDAGIAEWHRALELNPNLPGLRDQLQRVEP